jgi:GH25 family lysozyme M1 (1,4-beta-N-acetylmuramidase)
VAAGSLSFIALKATEGHAFVDPAFVDRFQRIVDYLPGTYVLAYHFLRTDSTPGDQMRHFFDVLSGVHYFDHARTLSPAVDAERGLEGQEPDAASVIASINTFSSIAGVVPGLYSGLDYWRTHFDAGVQPKYRWVARYADTPPTLAYDIWQDSETRTIAGRAYDHNVFFGSADHFVARVGRG